MPKYGSKQRILIPYNEDSADESSDNEKLKAKEKKDNENAEEDFMDDSPAKVDLDSPDNSPEPKLEDTEEDVPKDSLPLKKLKPVKKPELVTYRNRTNGER